LIDVQTLYIGALYTVDLHSAALFPPDFLLFAFFGAAVRAQEYPVTEALYRY